MVTWKRRAYIGQAIWAGQKAVPVALTVSVPFCTAVQISSCPCRGGDGAGSGRSRPGWVWFTVLHFMPASSSTSRTVSPTRTVTVWPESADVIWNWAGPAPGGLVVVVVARVGGATVGTTTEPVTGVGA